MIQQTDYPALDRLIYSLDARFTTYSTSHIEESYQTPVTRIQEYNVNNRYINWNQLIQQQGLQK